MRACGCTPHPPVLLRRALVPDTLPGAAQLTLPLLSRVAVVGSQLASMLTLNTHALEA